MQQVRLPKSLNVSRLCEAMSRSRLATRRFRDERVEMVREYVGHHWSDEGASKEVPVNLLAQYVSIVGRSLISQNPRAMLTTASKVQRPMVSAMEAWCNEQIEAMRFAETLQRTVIDSLFSIGIAKVALATPEDAARVSWNMHAGTPMIAGIDLDDFVWDVHAKRFDECGYLGHRYRVPLEVAMGDKRFTRERNDLVATPDELFNKEGDYRIGVLGRGVYASNYEEFEDFVSLWEVYIPRHRLVITLADDNLIGANEGRYQKPLAVQRWLGPDCGPYHLLGQMIVPGNAMPKAPIQDLFPLHVAMNNIYRKGIRQAVRQKDIVAADRGATEDMARVRESSDGDLIRMDRPDAAKVLKFGGPDANNLQFGLSMKDLFSWLAGNLDAIGGLSPQAKTLGQDQLLAASSSKQVGDMQDNVLRFTTNTLEALLWFWYHHPTHTMKTEFSVPGLKNISVQRHVTPQDRQTANFSDLKLKVDPYSLTHKTPDQRLASINQVMTQIVIPLMGQLQAQGVTVDMNAYLGIVQKLLAEPELLEIISITQPQQDQGESQSPEPTKPQQTSREYIRRSVGQDTGANRASGMANMLANQSKVAKNGQVQHQ